MTPSLSELTTLRLGGPARQYLRVTDAEQIVAAVRGAEPPVLVIAGGSNLVVADAGFDGTVVHIDSRGVVQDGTTLTVQAGESWDGFVARCVAEGLAGVECLSGIPGSVGATPIQNVGAYGQEVAETITNVRVFDREQDAVVDLEPAECGFGYRASRFKYHDRWVVLSVTFALTASATGRPRYAELTNTVGEEATLADIRTAVLALRRSKGMVLDPADPDSTSAGSFFTNPILGPEAYEALRRRVAPERPPAWPEPDGRVKTSAAWLIGRAGFQRGHARGDAAISGKHLLALTNRGRASTDDLVALAREIRDGVRDQLGVELHPEPVLVGVSL